MATLANSTTHVQWASNVFTGTLGQSSSVNLTVYRGQPVFIGADADGNGERIVEIDDISAEAAAGILLAATADIAYTNNQASVALFPMRILTNNVKGASLPTATADNRVYIEDNGQFANADDDSAGHSYGTCVDTRTLDGVTYYELNLTGRDET